MYKFFCLISLYLLFYTLSACSQGFITTNSPPAANYFFTGYDAPLPDYTNCNITVSPYLCSRESSSITIDVSFATSTPSAYLQIPPTSSLATGVIIESAIGCSNNMKCFDINHSCKLIKLYPA